MNQPGRESAVIVIDLQKCFLPGGTLPTTNSRNTITPKSNYKDLGKDTTNFIKELNPKPNHLFISLDWHPKGHISFINDELRSKGKKTVVEGPNYNFNKKNTKVSHYLFKQSLRNNKDYIIKTTRLWGDENNRLKQTLWPPHCIQNTPDAMVDDSLDIKKLTDFKPKYVLKGFDPEVDSYSVVADAVGEPTPFIYSGNYEDLSNYKNNELDKSNTFLNTLKNSNITEVYLTGIARNVCVFWSAMDLLQFWILPAYFGIDGVKKIIKLYFVYDLTRPVVGGLEVAGLDISKENIEKNVANLINKYKEVNNITDKDNTIFSTLFEVKDSSQVLSMNGGSRKHKNKNYNKTRKTRKTKSRKTRKTKSKNY
jgi:nicotinamidase-related amidase